MGKRLLVVDSDRRFIQDHKSSLESAFEVDFLYATDGALTRLEGDDYGAVLLCVETSENKGYALCSAIRRAPIFADVKIALISAKASEEEYARHRATKGKADLYLHKPVTSNALIPALAEFLPMKEDDPDNPLGDLAGADLGDEWLESLKAELDGEGGAPHLGSVPSVPTEAVPAGFVPMESAAKAIAPVAGWANETSAERTIRNQGEVELLEWRVKDLELKLAAQYAELERKTHEIEDLIQRNAAVTRNLDEYQQTQGETELLKQRCLEQAGESDRLKDDLQDALEEQKRLVDQLEESNVLLAEKTQQNAELLESHQLLQAQLEEAWELGDKVKALEASLGEAQEAARTQEARAALAEQHLADQQADLESARAQALELAGKAQDLEAAQARIQEMEPELTSARDQVSFQEMTIRNLAEERSKLQAERERLDDARTEQAGELFALQEKFSALEAGAGSAAQERERLQEANGQLEAALAERDGRLEGMEAAHEVQRRELMAGIDEREGRIFDLDAQLRAGQERLDELQGERERLEGQLLGHRENLDNLTLVLSELEGKARQALDLAKAVTR
jgi:CheY-like chemotaxis protein/chromosome segregation ATPase